jgi:hypothetical protein
VQVQILDLAAYFPVSTVLVEEEEEVHRLLSLLEEEELHPLWLYPEEGVARDAASSEVQEVR